MHTFKVNINNEVYRRRDSDNKSSVNEIQCFACIPIFIKRIGRGKNKNVFFYMYFTNAMKEND